VGCPRGVNIVRSRPGGERFPPGPLFMERASVASLSKVEYDVYPPLRGPLAVPTARILQGLSTGPGASSRIAKDRPRPVRSWAWFEVFDVRDGMNSPAVPGVLFYAPLSLTPSQFGAATKKAISMAISRVSHLLESAYKYASTQVNITGHAKAAMLGAGLSIPSDELGEDGREARPHVTVQYGLTEVTPKTIEELSDTLRGHGPFRLEFGRTRLFEPEDKDHVVFVSVTGGVGSLKALRREIRRVCDCVDTFPTYTPHATVAYVKPEVSSKYKDKDWCEGLECVVRHVVLTDRDKTTHRITL